MDDERCGRCGGRLPSVSNYCPAGDRGSACAATPSEAGAPPVATETCPKCKGQKYNSIHFNYGPRDHRSGWYRRPCRWCDGKGQVGPDVLDRIAMGQRLRDDRKARGLDAQAEAERLGITFDELIAMEIGLPEGARYFDDWQPAG